MSLNVFQGKFAVLSFYKNSWLTYVCSTDTTLSLNSSELPIKTPGSGVWKSVTYEDASFSLNLGGVLIYDVVNWTGLDFIENWLGFVHMRFRLALVADDGTVKSFQGYVMISGHDLSFNVTAPVKSSMTLPGNGELQFFDGYIPCDSEITSITVTGQTAADGIIHIAYTYTGAPYQVKYRIDGIGDYILVLIGGAIDIPGLSIGSHYVEMITRCTNGYDSDTTYLQDFVVTRALVCAVTCTDITIGANSADPVFDAPVPYFKYRFDSGTWITVTWPFTISLVGLSNGSHDLEVVPICLNLVEGTGFTKTFTYASPTQSEVDYSMSSWVAGNVLQIYVDSGFGFVLVATQSTNGSGSIMAPIGSTVKGVLSGNVNSGNAASLNTADTTTSTTLDNQSGFVPVVLQYSFSSNGDTFAITATISP